MHGKTGLNWELRNGKYFFVYLSSVELNMSLRERELAVGTSLEAECF